jgi:hypothetical protein
VDGLSSNRPAKIVSQLYRNFLGVFVGRIYRVKSIELTITFIGKDGARRSDTQQVQATVESDSGGEHSLLHSLITELKVDVGHQIAPKHNEKARRWMKFPKTKIPASKLTQFHDVLNCRAMWLELSNLVLGVESDLNLAHAFKALEPDNEPEWGDDTAIGNLHYIHDRKMTLLNRGVYGLVKTQDLVNRLLHESLGGDLVDTRSPDWEQETLRRSNVMKGLSQKLKARNISTKHWKAIIDALDIPKKSATAMVTTKYRNKLTHHVRPSVDYPMFFSYLESRTGKEIKNAQGKAIRTTFTLSVKPKADFQFNELYNAFSKYLDSVASMLNKLSHIDILHK